MKCLYITSKPIYPIIDGGCFAMDSFLKLLFASGVEVDHIAISTQKHPFDHSAYPKEVPVQSVAIDTTIKPLQALSYLIKKGAYNVERFHSDEVLKTIRNSIQNNNFDVIILDSLYSTTYLNSIRDIFNGRVYLRSHNCEAQIWYDLADNEKNIPKAIYYKKLARDLDKYEMEVIQKVDGVLAISPEDLDMFKKCNDALNAIVIPVQLECFNDEFKVESNQLFHLGNMDWIPNVDAVERLIKIFKRIREKNKTIKLHIGGKHSERAFNSEPDLNIHVEGFIDDLKHFARSHGILVSPIASSSGVRIKILEMMSFGVPIITTEAGARGILPEGKKIIKICNSDKELETTILELSTNQKKLQEMSTASVEYISNYHNIDKVAKDLKSFIGA